MIMVEDDTLMDNDDYLKSWVILMGRVRKKTRHREALFGSSADYRDWVKSVASHGLSLAIQQISLWDPTRGDFHQWAFLKTRALMRDGMATEERFFKARSSLAKEPAPSYRDDLEPLLEKEDMSWALALLSPDQQEAIALFYEADLPVKEIEQIMERDRAAVDALLYRGRRKLRSLLEKPPEQPTTEIRSQHRPQRSPGVHRARSQLDGEDGEDPPDLLDATVNDC